MGVLAQSLIPTPRADHLERSSQPTSSFVFPDIPWYTYLGADDRDIRQLRLGMSGYNAIINWGYFLDMILSAEGWTCTR